MGVGEERVRAGLDSFLPLEPRMQHQLANNSRNHLVFQNKIYDENKRLLVEGEVTLVATDFSSFKPIKLPASLLSLIQK